MYELAWVRELFERWPQATAARSGEPFFVLLRTVDHESLRPDAAAVAAAAEAPGIHRLWAAWLTFRSGDPRRGFAAFRKVARQFPASAEAAALLGAAGLLAGSREVGWKAWHEARRLDARYAFLDPILAKFGRRGRAVLPFLHRDHGLNVALGRLRARLRGR